MSANMSPTSMFAYTASQWLHLDKPQRDARYIEFNVDRLCEKVLSLCPSGTSIESCQKLEVQCNTKVPILAILDWSDDPNNPIGSAYIIMEHAGGVPLQEAWADMPSDKKVKCIGAICTSILPISELDFLAYGSLYFADASFLDAASKQKLDNDLKYCIGPHCRGSTYWDCNVGEPRYYTFKEPNRGPSDHLILCQQQASYQGSVNQHLELLKVGQAVFSELLQHPGIKSNATPTLFHPDLHKRNIFISKDDPTTVTGIIDWQCASVEPAFYYTDDAPDFAKVSPEGTSESSEETLCSQAYELGWALLAPHLGETRKIDETLLRPFRYCHWMWRDGFVPFTHELMQLREAWKKLGFKKDCPIPALSPEEMRSYKEQLGIYNGMLEFRQDMVETLGVEGDGWVSEDHWEGVKKAHQYFYETIMASMENDKDREELRTMWPFDQCQA
ncbi:hypothetical protein CPC735_000060 [Coccidioides posadasii C735 delta SOWgp]|uniref:Altered inheritance of mitochondria protein 9, mitochondrial n=1 Tax=Coccidioides posadasii (strain C735) TaxID=222929 RepID=C5NZX3_COCP7|nr:hypothetical protein CPC735_000060 [Coccidioides posadasii C735 delta SOWgp]EER29750.1 hypothetical protein CPC735_000060 [Coccidioides posadasii C735 delta SOWgp]|eukprot:XP_003071895.1 hypothetical protein CPC735_000060 [Coccidioides posadasii C735 delta SOWgp]